jgi:transcriptional regulator with XRE-family HTH domain
MSTLQDQDMRITHPNMLRAAIDRAGLTYRGLAARSECSKSFIGALVNGDKTGVTPELAERIAEALEVPRDLLFVPTGSGDSGPDVRRVRTAA